MTTLSDEMLCLSVRKGNPSAEETLILRYRPLISRLVRPYILSGFDGEDLTQEGYIGLTSAIRGYDASKGALFKTFAYRCVANRVLSCVKAASRFKVELPDCFTDETASAALTPEEEVISRESAKTLETRISGDLSKLERSVLELYLAGLPYVKISAQLGVAQKSVDNAIQRIRRKLR